MPGGHGLGEVGSLVPCQEYVHGSNEMQHPWLEIPFWANMHSSVKLHRRCVLSSLFLLLSLRHGAESCSGI